MAGEPERGVDLVGPDWAVLAAAYGMPAEVVDGAGTPLRDALDRARAACTAEEGPRMVVLPAALYPPRTTSPRWHEDEGGGTSGLSPQARRE